MNNTAAAIKCRTLLGKLAKHSIEASRRTRPPDKDWPDALLVAADGRAWLVAIWSGNTVQPTLLALAGPGGGTLDDTLLKLADWRAAHRTGSHEAMPDLLILAPALPVAELPSQIWRAGAASAKVIGKESCRKSEGLAAAILSTISRVLPPAAITCWRAAAVPEVRIDSPWKRRRVEREAHSPVAPLLLDYKQERCARLDLEPDPAHTPLVKDLNVRLVTGVAGCGKTLILVHRAALLASHFPNARVLLLSFNRPLVNDLTRRIQRLKLKGRIECLTFNQWLHKMAPPQGGCLSPHEVIRWIERERQRQPAPALAKMPSDWIREEMAWMCDHGLADVAYLTAERKGRRTPLNAGQRSAMLEFLLRYRAWLKQESHGDWAEWPLGVKERPPQALANEMFDHILIDEVQFFAPVWLDLIRSALKPGGHFFLCADPTQGFLSRRTSWLDIGLDVRNRSIRLERPYRSTRAILEFARDFYLRRLPGDDEPLNLPAPEWLEGMESGMAPILQPAGPPQDQLDRLAIELRRLREEGVPLGDVLIILAGRSQKAEQVISILAGKLGPDTVAGLKAPTGHTGSAGVTHLMAATGLERPVVFLLGLDDLAAEERNPTLSPEEQAGKHHAFTRQIYVGLTRAMERLVIYTSDQGLRRDFGAEPPQQQESAAI